MPSYVVLGATGIIGNALVRRLAADNGNLVVGLSRRAMEPPVQGVKEVRGDLTDLESLKTAAEEIKLLTRGKLDLLILASSQAMSPNPVMGHGEEAQIADVILPAIAQSTIGNIQLISLLLPLLKEGSIKKVVHITTGHGNPLVIQQLPVSANLGLAVSKGALDIVFNKFAKDYKADGLTFLSITPSLVQSKASASKSGMDRERMAKAMSATFPDFSGIHEPDDGARILLDSIDKLGLEDSGKVYGMWGTQDKWA